MNFSENCFAHELGKQRTVIGLALCALAINPLGQSARAVVVLDNTPAPQGFNQFAAPANPGDGNTYILSRGYAFDVGDSAYTIDSVSAYLYAIFGFNGIVPTARLELRTYDGTAPGQLLESLLISIGTDSDSLSTYSVPSWNLSPNNSYWIGLNWVGPYNQGNTTIETSALFGWSVVEPPSFPVMGTGFTDLGFAQFAIGGGAGPSGSWGTYPCFPNNQCNSLRVNASPATADVPVPLPIFGVAAAFAYSRTLRQRAQSRRGADTISMR